MLSLVALQVLLIPPGGDVPAFILHKGIIRPQIHGHGRAADRTGGVHPVGHLAQGGLAVVGGLIGVHLGQTQKIPIIFAGGVYGVENTFRLANVRVVRRRCTARAMQRAAVPSNESPTQWVSFERVPKRFLACAIMSAAAF